MKDRIKALENKKIQPIKAHSYNQRLSDIQTTESERDSRLSTWSEDGTLSPSGEHGGEMMATGSSFGDITLPMPTEKKQKDDTEVNYVYS